MIKQIIKCLKENPQVSDWLITETATDSRQSFYVLQKLETTRAVITAEYLVTVYHRYQWEGTDYVGSSSFALSHKLTKKELAKKIEEAVFASTFIRNKAYTLVKGNKKKSWKEAGYKTEPFVLLERVAETFFQNTDKKCKFNSLEVFYTKTVTRTMNSQGVDLRKTLYRVNVEAIPSYDGENQKVELYRYYTYSAIDFDAIKEDAMLALRDVTARYQAKLPEIKKANLLLKGEEIASFFSELISDYSYSSVYKQNTDKKIGDSIQDNPKKDLLTISLMPTTKADAFDRDGVVVKPVTILKNGTLANYYGDNQYAQYLGFEPTGRMDTIKAEKGKTSHASMAKKPHLEIIALSGIQIDVYSDYIGGEVRLAIYFDGKDYYPLSGFSFSGSIKNCLSQLVLSKEIVALHNYRGPKYILLPDMEIV